MHLERRYWHGKAVTLCTAGHAHVHDVVVEYLVLHPDTRAPFVLAPALRVVHPSMN